MQCAGVCRVRQVSCTVRPAFAIVVVCAVVGADWVAARHDEFAGAEHHVLVVRHGEFHNLLVVCIGVAAVVGPADGVAVQAEDFGVGGDDYGGAFVGVEIPCRASRSIRVPRVYAVHLAHTAIRYGDLEGFGGQPRLAVERAAGHAAVVIRQARREGAAGDYSVAV